MFKGRSLGRPPKVARISQTVETSSEPIQWAPEETDADSKREQVVLRMTDFNRPENTTRAYEGKTEEYYEYCDAVYPRDRGRYTLKPFRVYRFIFYQAMRPKKKRGGPPSKRQGNHFDHELYKQTMAAYEAWFDSPEEAPEEPDNPVGEATIALYKTVIRNIYRKQTAEQSLTLTWDQIWGLSCLNLHNLVKIRRPAADKRNYKEKFEDELSPYEIAEEFPKLEAFTWKKGEDNRLASALLRHRFCLLFSTNGILWSESLYRADLSDCRGLWTKKDTDVHKIYMLILQIPKGSSKQKNALSIVAVYLTN